MRTKPQSSQRKLSWAGMLITLAVIILFSCSQKVLAQQWSTSGDHIHNSNSGNVGVGITSPGVKLDILSSVNLIARFGSTAGSHTQVLIDAQPSFNSNLTLQRGGISKWFMGNRASNDRLSFIESTGGVEVLTLLQNGKVGVGTSNPQDAFHVFNTTNAVGTMRLQGGNNVAGFIGVWDFGPMLLLSNNRHPGTGNNFKTTVAGAQINVGAASSPGDIAFFTTSSGTVGNDTELVRMKANGNVGIGTTTPGAKLEVVGNVNVTGTGNITAAGTIEGGNIKAKYQDVAEWVESSQELPAGTIVVVDHTKSNQVIASSQPYDTRVAGVISSQPGIALGEAGHNKVLVATTGRVRIKVDASHGPIQVGDLLVTSNIPGVAMKSQGLNIGGVQLHRPGTLIGKALEPLAKGSGEILVLLSLQ